MSENKRYNFLDSSRGLAAFVVLLAHTIKTFAPANFYTPLSFLWDSEAAVLYFFILSGFVLTESIREIQLSPRSYFNFIGKRILRIYPAFLYALLSAFLLYPFFNDQQNGWLSNYWKNAPNIIDVLKQSILVFRFPNDPELRLLPHDWTLSIEILISLALPFIAWIAQKYFWIALIVVFAMIKLLPIDPFIMDFTLGCVISTQKENLISVWKKIHFLGHVLIMILGFYLINFNLFMAFEEKPISNFLIDYKSWGLSILLIVLISSIRLQKFFENNFLNFQGKISYSYYLIHFIIIAILFKFLPDLKFIPAFAIVLTSTILIASASYFLIERPCIQVGKKYFSGKKGQ